MTIDLNELRRLAESWLPEPGRLAINEERLADGCIALLDRLAAVEAERDEARHISSLAMQATIGAERERDEARHVSSLASTAGSVAIARRERDEWRLEAQRMARQGRADRDRLLAERHAVCDALQITTDDDAENPAGVAMRIVADRDRLAAEAERLRATGFESKGYDVARAEAVTLIDQRDAMRRERAGLAPLAAVPDEAPAAVVAAYVATCAEAWAPGARLLGNARAVDIARACRSLVAELEVARAGVAWRQAALAAIADRITTIADEAFGPFPVQPIDENLTAIERGIAAARIRDASSIAARDATIAELRGLLTDARRFMRPAMGAQDMESTTRRAEEHADRCRRIDAALNGGAK